MAMHSSILARQIPWMEEPGRLQTLGLKESDSLSLSLSLSHTHTHTHIVVLISHASKIMLKILQARLQQYMI